MTRQEFNSYLDELTAETGFDLTKDQKAFAYQAAKKYHEQALAGVMSTFTLYDLKKAFIDGQNSVTAEIGYERYGDMDEYAKKVINKNFDKWFEENYL